MAAPAGAPGAAGAGVVVVGVVNPGTPVGSEPVVGVVTGAEVPGITVEETPGPGLVMLGNGVAAGAPTFVSGMGGGGGGGAMAPPSSGGAGGCGAMEPVTGTV